MVKDLFNETLNKDTSVRCTYHRDMEWDDAHRLYACGDAIATWRAAMLMGPPADPRNSGERLPGVGLHQ